MALINSLLDADGAPATTSRGTAADEPQPEDLARAQAAGTAMADGDDSRDVAELAPGPVTASRALATSAGDGSGSRSRVALVVALLIFVVGIVVAVMALWR